MIHTRNITLKDLFECFFPKKGNEYSYLGYAYYYSKESLLRDFFIEVDKVARPKWCPKFFLRLLNLFGNDNSIVRVRNWKLHNLFNKITKGIRVTDTKWKWDTFRIYGHFTKELRDLAEETCRKIESYDKRNL